MDWYEIGLDDGQVVAVNAEDEHGFGRRVDQAKKISLSSLKNGISQTATRPQCRAGWIRVAQSYVVDGFAPITTVWV